MHVSATKRSHTTYTTPHSLIIYKAKNKYPAQNSGTKAAFHPVI